MKIACTGFVSEQAGSVASANALILRALLDLGHEVTFFSKPSFVDPRHAVGEHENFHFFAVVNHFQDQFRERVERVPGFGFLAGRWDAFSYNRLIVKRMNDVHARAGFDVILWLGDYARGAVANTATVSFVQGAPGSDARSILKYYDEIEHLNGRVFATRLALLAKMRLTSLGLPPFSPSDLIVVGSPVSEEILRTRYRIAPDRAASLPYPIDLDLFSPQGPRIGPGLRVLWLGRIVPRKRLSVFLDGIALARKQGIDIRGTVVGKSAGMGDYEQLLQRPVADGWIDHVSHLDRSQVPQLFAQHDLLVQPSEEENFGSSVAEAQACGIPVIVGQTNGNRHYLCQRDVILNSDDPSELAHAFALMDARKREGTLGDPMVSRAFAVREFNVTAVAERLQSLLVRAQSLRA